MKKTLFIVSLLVLSTACQRNPNARNYDNSMRRDNAPGYDQRVDGRDARDARDGQRYDSCGNPVGNDYNQGPGYDNRGPGYNNQGPGPYNNGAYNNGPNNTQEDDWTINERVRNALYNDPSMPPSTRAINVETRDRVVTLTGNVNTKDEANFLIRKVKGIQGVRSVNNQITVAGQYPQGQYNTQGQ